MPPPVLVYLPGRTPLVSTPLFWYIYLDELLWCPLCSGIFTWTNYSGAPPPCSGNIYLDELLWCPPSVLIKVHHREEGVGGVGQLPLDLLLRESNIVCKMLPVGFLNRKCKNIIFNVLIKS